MAPPQAFPVLGQMEILLHLSLPRPDFNNCPGDNSVSGCIYCPRHLFESDSNNGPSPGHSNLGQMEDTSVQVPTCGLLVSALAGQGPQS